MGKSLIGDIDMAERLFPAFPDDGCSAAVVGRLRGAAASANWDKSPAGAVEGWPWELQFAVWAMLHAASPMAVLIGRDGIVACNPAASEMFGDAFATAQGASIFDVLPVARDFYRKVIDDAHRGLSARFRDHPVRLSRDGAARTCWFNLGISPIMDGDGRVFGTLLIGSETSEHVRTRRALNLAHERIETALAAGGIVGTWEFDVASRRAAVDGSLVAQYGVVEADARDGVPIETLIGNIHPEDRDHVLAALDAAVIAGEPFHDRFRATDRDGALRGYVASGWPTRDARGIVSGFAGIVVDVAGEAGAAAAAGHGDLRFEVLAEAIPQIVWSTDRHGRHDYFNSRWSEFTGLSAGEITPDSWARLVHPDDAARVEEAWRACLATGSTYEIDYRFRRHDGVYRWLRVIAMPMRDRDGSLLRWYGTSIDIDDARRLDDRRELVNRELDHRIKNLFALVNGLVGVAAREQPQLAPLTGELRARLTALHKAHELIRNRPDREGRSLRRLLGELLAPFVSRETEMAVIGGGDGFVTAETLPSMALIFHELVTNAAKYGALKDPRGRLVITFSPGPDWFEVVWEERMPQAASALPAGSGFGSVLLEAIVVRQLGGELTRAWSPSGLTIRLRLPHGLFGTAAADETAAAAPG